MMFTPTKWTHHFGVYAGLAGSLAALTAVAVSAQPRCARARNRTLFAAGLLFVLALCVLRHQRLVVRLELRRAVVGQAAVDRGRASSTVLARPVRLALLLVAAGSTCREPYREPRERPHRTARLAVARGAADAWPRRSWCSSRCSRWSRARSRSTRRTRWRVQLRRRSPATPAGWPTTYSSRPTRTPAMLTPDQRRHAPNGPDDPLAQRQPTGFSPNGVPDRPVRGRSEVKPGAGKRRQPVASAPTFATTGTTRRHRRRHRRGRRQRQLREAPVRPGPRDDAGAGQLPGGRAGTGVPDLELVRTAAPSETSRRRSW